MKFGLSLSEYEFLDQNLIRPLKERKARVFIFGSRAQQKHHKFSDVDLLFIEDDSHPIEASVISNILLLFEESHFPYKIDLVNNRNLAQSYRANVDTTRIEI